MLNSAYKVVDEDNLFASLEKAAKEDNKLTWDLNVRDMFASWSNQKGYPLLTVERNYHTNTITLSQRRFLNSQVELAETPTWWIPYNYATLTNPNFNDTSPDGWLPHNVKSKVIYGNCSPKEWIVFNKQQTGFYRVLYDETNYKLLAKQLNSENFTAVHAFSRSQIIDDLLEFLLIDLVKPDTLYEVLSYLQHETEYVPWVPALRAIDRINFFLSGSKYNKKFRSYVARLSAKFFESTGVEEKPDENHFRKDSRFMATNLACQFGEQSCLKATHKKLKEFLYDNNGRLDLTLLSGETYYIYMNGMRSATSEDAKLIWNRLITPEFQTEGSQMPSLFRYVEDDEMIAEYLAKSIVDVTADSLNLKRDLFGILCFENQHGIPICIEFLRKHASDVKQAFNELDFYIYAMSTKILSPSVRKQMESLLIHLRNQKLISDGTVSDAHNMLSAQFEAIDRHQEVYEAWFSGSPKGSSAKILFSSMTLVLSTIVYSLVF